MKVLRALIVCTTLLLVILAGAGQIGLFDHSKQKSPAMTNYNQSKKETNQPKYSFYDDLKERKEAIQEEEKLEEKTTDTNESNPEENKTDSTYYTVQVGAFKKEDDAKKLANKVNNLGFKTQIKKSNTSFFLVQTEAIKGKSSAEKTISKLKKEGLDTLLKRM